ncbi:MAG: NAD(P)-dependent glycerol-3-phosphate dehydrogenase [Alphaproteobacteria bacterium]|nr:NAD(P)-dependent glycerol-3-phosphate dehydrogenase [Alphaproteobacteria bacterium]MBU1281618.1 NAD(P)-dependent glycerol-3-phosphate dehydrogenase [Alphaproteobacteria bacterium]MBU1574937.1 NAD(P)-dependent glycerol-3-phosphate dehydrogenase [Alphaproteobacteria bacterium]MBU1827519.1 NAD(P)-dependent glycerol-3-phosphate dehydrogenase [Alphaproteobacteria bacterium]MBU2077292.1 NAD(P)-dependent glycerol-3-phosphate dehydrogenase [Alphaproteobacteria bacterium]
MLGAGSWGTALATVLARNGREVRLWARRPDLAERINLTRQNSDYLPEVDLPNGLTATADLAHALAGAEAVLMVTPSATLRPMCQAIASHLPAGIPIALACKGVERGSGYLLSEVVSEELPGHPVGAVSGPTFAHETALDHPTAATVAFPFAYQDRLTPESSPAVRLSMSLSGGGFRPYVSDDLVGVEVGGAVKNVIAIACGMMSGAGFAENTRAAFITRGTDEMKLLAQTLGGKRETVTGLSGAGDLTLTCSSTTSRNMSLGYQLGQGIARPSCFEGRPVVVEGEVNAASVTDLARRLGVSMPICETVNAVLHKGADLREAFTALWSRPIEAEPYALDLSIDHPSPDLPLQFGAV